MSEHGTPARWLKHYRDGDEPCEPCNIARREYQKTRVRKPETEATKENRRRHSRLWYRAARELINRHRAEFHTIHMHLLKETIDADQPE